MASAALRAARPGPKTLEAVRYNSRAVLSRIDLHFASKSAGGSGRGVEARGRTADDCRGVIRAVGEGVVGRRRRRPCSQPLGIRRSPGAKKFSAALRAVLENSRAEVAH